ncbi:MAG: ATP-binding protein [Methylobacter sp.]
MNKQLSEDFATLRNSLLNDLLFWLIVTAVPGVGFSIARILFIGWKPLFAVHIILLIALCLLWLGRKRISYLVRVYGVLIILWLTSMGGLAQFGPIGLAGVFSILIAFIAILFLTKRIALILSVFNILSLILIGWAASRHWLTFDLDYQDYAYHPLTWANVTWTFTAYSIILAQIGSRMIQGVLDREAQIRKAQQRLSASLENAAHVAVQWYNEDGQVRFWNHASELMFGWPASEALGKTLDQLILGEEEAIDFQTSLGLINTYKTTLGPVEFIARHRDGRQVITSTTLFMIPDEDEPIFVCMHVDITQRKRAEIALDHAKQMAESASQAKSEFLTSMSHELRTPLNAIIGFAQLLDMDQPMPSITRKEAIGHIANSGRHLLGLINEVLDLARIESGRLDLNIQTIALLPLIQETVALSQPAAKLKNVVIMQVCHGNLQLSADPARVRQILLNLLSNAIKYNREGGIVILSCTALDNYVRVTVADTGMGITKARQQELFQSFHRLGAEKSNIEGTGIGLVICKQLVKGMKGRIGFDSTEDAGSQFWFELPHIPSTPEIVRNPTIQDQPGLPDKQRPNGKCVLYIEDNPVNIEVMKHIFLAHQDIELLTATTAKTGLAMIADRPPDLVLMDINLPGISGLDALIQLKANPDTAAIPVIAVSAATLPNDIEAGLSAGFLAYLTKPLDVPELNALILRTLQKCPS